MSDPWGISGPAFLWIYGGLMVGVWLVVRPLLTWAARRSASHGGQYPGSTPTVYQLAYLAGGPHRAIDTAIAALVERGGLRVSSARTVTATGAMPADPLERAVGDAANRPQGRTTSKIHSM